MFWKRKPPPTRPPETELESLRRQLAQRQETAAALEQELFDLRRFVAEVEAHLLPLQNRLAQLRAQLAQARLGRWGRPAERAYFTEAAEPAPSAPSAPPPAEPADAPDLKTLYRLLAKRFHPDLASDPDEKAWRQAKMAEVNAAYSAHDRAALEALAEAQSPPPVSPRRAEQAATPTALRAEIDRLDGVIAELEGQLDTLAQTPAVQLKLDASLARHQGQNLLGQIAAELEAEIARVEAELAGLRS